MVILGSFWGDNMEMWKADEIALEESISDWNKRANGIDPNRDCPLCILGRKRDGKANNRDKCTNCIIKVHTGHNECKGTPYWHENGHAIDPTPEYYQREISFLESLRPKKKVEKDVIEIGDEVNIRDYSGALRLTEGKVVAFGEIWAKYIVVRVGTVLPESDDNLHKGKYNNDTILYEPIDGNYIFTREKYIELVQLVKPKYCSECGKAK